MFDTENRWQQKIFSKKKKLREITIRNFGIRLGTHVQ